MTRAYNFSPGPALLPDVVLAEAQASFCEYADWRTSVMEISHRSRQFMQVYDETEALLRDLLHIGEDYAVLFLAGGATGQTAAVPLNLTGNNDTAAYIISGYWSRRAAAEAARFCRVEIIADSGNNNDTALPDLPQQPADPAAYLHIVDNETVNGVEYPAPPVTTLPLVADMSSNLTTRAVDINRFGLIYACAQKNLGIAGITVVIVRRALVAPQSRLPSVWDYQKQWTAQSMVNTPPTFSLYMLGRVLNWLNKQGGVTAAEEHCRARARLLYEFLDSSGFYQAAVTAPASRSRVNVPFFLTAPALTADFLAGAEAHGLLGLKGHRVLGGARASLYNSMPLAGVAALVDYMRDFAQRRG